MKTAFGEGAQLMDLPIAVQRAHWNNLNAAKNERPISEISPDQRELVVQWLSRIGRTDLAILEVGCGASWLRPSLKPFGHVTATDLSEGVLRGAADRVPASSLAISWSRCSNATIACLRPRQSNCVIGSIGTS